MHKRKVVLLGGSGSMGFATFKELYKRVKDKKENLEIVLLLRPSAHARNKFSPYCGAIKKNDRKTITPYFEILWGDGGSRDDMAEVITGADWIFNCMAVISPRADVEPDEAKRVNVDAFKNLLELIKAEKNGIQRIKVINVGSIAMYGDRMRKNHSGRVGDPLPINPFDYYGLTKYQAEHALLESGLQYWVQMRQTFIWIPDLFSLEDPVMFHQPLNCYMECVTAQDSGRAMANCLDIEDDSPFWRNVYNLGGGPSCRTNYLEFLHKMFGMLGMRVEKIFDRNWFALRNFHMMYYADTEKLNSFVHHQHDSLDDFLSVVWKTMPWYIKMVRGINAIKPLRFIVEKCTRVVMQSMAKEPSGPLYWIKNKCDDRIKAFYGSYDEYDSIPSWEEAGSNTTLSDEYEVFDHGYDESKDVLVLEDLRSAASFRGWNLLESEWDGDMYTPLKWRCSFGHEFSATAFTVLKAGHGCPDCYPGEWKFDDVARNNPFLAQAWYESHSKDEHNVYSSECYRDIDKKKNKDTI